MSNQATDTGERDNMAFVPQVVVRALDDGARKALYIASHAGRIFGMNPEEGSALIDELTAMHEKLRRLADPVQARQKEKTLARIERTRQRLQIKTARRCESILITASSVCLQ